MDHKLDAYCASLKNKKIAVLGFRRRPLFRAGSAATEQAQHQQQSHQFFHRIHLPFSNDTSFHVHTVYRFSKEFARIFDIWLSVEYNISATRSDSRGRRPKGRG